MTSDAAHGHVAYADCVGCLTGFARNKHSRDISLHSVRLMTMCTQITLYSLLQVQGVNQAQATAPNPAPIPSPNPLTASPLNYVEVGARASPSGAGTWRRGVVFTDSEEHVRLWFPVLTGLGGLAGDSRLEAELKAAALKALFEVLMHYGHLFSAQLWGIVSHGVLLPLFEDVHHLEELGDTAWLRTQIAPAIDFMTTLCLTFMPAISQPLADFLKVLSACVGQDEVRRVCSAFCLLVSV